MNIRFFAIGKSAAGPLSAVADDYCRRLKHYVSFTMDELVTRQQTSVSLQLQKEAEKMLALLKPADHVILLDVKGKELSSEDFALKLEKLQNRSVSSIVFIAGSAYGFHETLYKRADELFSLSKLTFTHQMVRMIFIEQLYRAFTIIKNEKYHH